MENLHIRLNEELADQLRKEAAKEYRTLAKHIEKVLMDYYEKTKEGEK